MFSTLIVGFVFDDDYTFWTFNVPNIYLFHSLIPKGSVQTFDEL